MGKAYLLLSLEGTGIDFAHEISLKLVNCEVLGLQGCAECTELLALGEVVLKELGLVGLELAGGSALGEEVAVSVVYLNSWLACIVVEEIGPDGDVATDEPEVVVALDEAAIDGNGGADTPQCNNGVDVPCDNGGGVLETFEVERSIRCAESTIELAYLSLGDVSEELSVRDRIDLTEPVLELDGVTSAGEDVLEKSSESLATGLLVDLEVVEVLTGGGIPLEEVGLLILDWALRSHTHL